MKKAIILLTLVSLFIFTGCLEDAFGEYKLMDEDVAYIIEGELVLDGVTFPDAQSEKRAISEALQIVEKRVQFRDSGMLSFEKGEIPGKFRVLADKYVNIQRIKWLITTPAVLDFKLVSKEGSEKLNSIARQYRQEGKSIVNLESGRVIDELLEQLLADNEPLFIAELDSIIKRSRDAQLKVVKRESLLGPSPVLDEVAMREMYGKYVISFSFAKPHIKKWADVTRSSIGKEIAIILDDLILSTPVIMDAIPNGQCQISLGSSTEQEIKMVGSVLSIRPLAYPVRIVSEENVVKPGIE